MTQNKSTPLKSAQISKLINANIWNDNLLVVHEKMSNLISETSTNTRFKCQICHRYKSSTTTDYVKHIPKHFRLTAHYNNMATGKHVTNK